MPRRLTLDRRTFLRGAGTIAIALPWLEVMGIERRAHAQSGGIPFKRFVTVYQPGGTVRDRYTPSGSETAFTLSPILRPLEPVKSRLLVLDGLELQSGDQFQFMVEQHQGGAVGLLTGAVQPGSGNFPKSPSIDQVLANRLSANKAFNGLELAVRWATGKSHGKLHPMNALYFQATAPYAAIPPRLDPQDIFKTLFGTAMPSTAGGMATADTARLRTKSILDYVDKRYADLSKKLGAADRAKLDQHLTQIRDLERRIMLSQPPNGVAACSAPNRANTTGYNPTSGLNSSDNGGVRDIETDKMIPEVGKFMMDMMVIALACDKTGVASLQWSDTEAKHTFPWLNLSEHHHFYQHDGGFRPAECEKIATWYSEMHAYLLQKLQQVDMGGRSLLDETLVLLGSELSDPPSHGKKNMPFLLAGGDGKTLRTGRWIKYADSPPHNRLLTTVLGLYGDTRTTFGDARIDSAPPYGTGPHVTVQTTQGGPLDHDAVARRRSSVAHSVAPRLAPCVPSNSSQSIVSFTTGSTEHVLALGDMVTSGLIAFHGCSMADAHNFPSQGANPRRRVPCRAGRLRVRRAAEVAIVLTGLAGLPGCEPQLIVGKWICPEATTPIPDKTAAVAVPWSTGFEDRFCDYAQVAGFCYANGRASYETVTSPVHSGEYAAAFSVASDDRDSVQSRCVRQGALPAEAYYGAWYFIPNLATNSGVWNLIHFQGGDPSAQHGLWDISLVNARNGDLQLVVFDFLNGVGRMPSSRPAVPIGAWFHLQFYLKRAADATGEVALYVDGQQVLEVNELVTDDSEFGQWYVGNYADALMPAKSTLYVDDVTISATP